MPIGDFVKKDGKISVNTNGPWKTVNKEFKSTYERMLAHYINCTGLKKKTIEKELLCEHDIWLTAEEALKFNIADEVIKSKHKKRIRRGK